MIITFKIIIALLLDWCLEPDIKPPKSPTIVRWKSPWRGWIKINFDGAREAEGIRARVCFVVRSYDAVVVAAMAPPVHDSGINNIELLATWFALSWAHNMIGMNTIWLHGDFRIVVELLNQVPHTNDDLILVDCKILISNLQAFEVSHIFR